MAGSNGSNGGMGGMMGNGSTSTASPSYLWFIPVVLGVVVGIAIIGVAFYFAYPELKYISGTCNPNSANPEAAMQAVNPAVQSSNSLTKNVTVTNGSNNCEVLLKTMTPEEQKVITVLLAHQGKYLQKYVVKEAGLSRLKTHRIVARFAERGIVSVKEFGNTNEILLADWVKGSEAAKTTAS